MGSLGDHKQKQQKRVVVKRLVKVCTDKVKLASVAKKLLFWKIVRQAVVLRYKEEG
jgi:hypothetical protein